MKAIFCKIGDSTFLVGYSSSLESFLDSYGEDLFNIEYQSTNHATCFHHGQRLDVTYRAETIIENQRCFYKAV